MEGYRFVLPIEVHFADLDGMGHINNAVYLTYMESARIAWWMQVTGRRTLRGSGGPPRTGVAWGPPGREDSTPSRDPAR